MLEVVHLVPETTFAEHVAVVGGENDGGVVGHCVALDHVEHRADMVIDVADVGEVRVAGHADLVVGDRGHIGGDHMAQPSRMRVELVVRNDTRRRHRDRVVVVQVPELLTGDVRIVRMGERRGHHPGPVVGTAREVPQLAYGVVGDVVVVVELVRHVGDAGVDDRIHVVEPPIESTIGIGPVRGPAEVGRVDVGGQSFFEPVQLIGSDEVHLADQ